MKLQQPLKCGVNQLGVSFNVEDFTAFKIICLNYGTYLPKLTCWEPEANSIYSYITELFG